MDENKEKKAVEAEVIKEDNTNMNNDVIRENDNSNKKFDGTVIVDFLKAKKKIILIAIIAIIVIIVAIDLIFLSPKEVVQKFVKALDSKDMEKAIKYVNSAGNEVLYYLDDDDYDDFWSEYKDFKDSDDYQDIIDEMEDMDEEDYEELNDYLDDLDFSVKIEKIKDVKKVASHLYKVSAKLKVSSDGEEESGTVYFYVMKEGTKSYIIDFDSNSLYSFIYLF